MRVSLHRITGESIVRGRFIQEALLSSLDDAAAIVFGSPTFMGGPAAEFKAFADATSSRWSTQAWSGKVAAGFTVGGCANGDQGFTLGYLSILAAQHGMVWCGLDVPGDHPLNRLGTQVGLSAQEAAGHVTDEDQQAARHLGRRVAGFAARLGPAA
jgi:multimeric flavodoxin WrbA